MDIGLGRRGGLWRALGAGCAALAWAVAAPAQVGGTATDSDSDGGCIWTSTIHTSSEVSPDECAQMANGLNAQDINTDSGWTVSFAGMLSAGAVTIDQYYAWVTQEPTVTCGGVEFPGAEVGRIGGAVFCLNYVAGEDDPMGADVHWVQAIRTDCPSAFGMAHGMPLGGGLFDYLDNEGAAGTDPFYDTGGAAGSTYFLDIPFRRCDDDCMNTCTWDACVFLATGSVEDHTLTLYGVGYEWGFTFECTPVPEPAAAALLWLGAVVACRRRRCAED